MRFIVRPIFLAAAVSATPLVPGSALAQNDAAELRQLVSEVEQERKLVFSPFGEVSSSALVVLDRDQVGTMAVYMIENGLLELDDLETWTRKQIAFSKAILRVMKEQLARLESGQDWSDPNGQSTPAPRETPAPGNATYWPDPMDWAKVRGTIRGSFVAECEGGNGYPAVRLAGLYRLELRGNGSIGGAFEGGALLHDVSGTIRADGTASGLAQSGAVDRPHLSWTAGFRRSGDRPWLASSRVELMAALRGEYSILLNCRPGSMTQD